MSTRFDKHVPAQGMESFLNLRGIAPELLQNRYELTKQVAKDVRSGDRDNDWFVAENMIEFGCFMLGAFNRPYLSREATTSTVHVIAKLNEDLSLDRNDIACLAVLDGAYEYGFAKYLKHRDNCVNPTDFIRKKDDRFARMCIRMLRLYSGRIPNRENLPDAEAMAPRRVFQDAIPCAFGGDAPLLSALAAALHLRREVATADTEANWDWIEQMHCRIVIASSWESAVKMLPACHRNEVFLQTELWSKLDKPAKRLIGAAGAVAMRVDSVEPESPTASLPNELVATH